MRLDRLLRPRSVAVIGGGTWCANVVRECRKIGFNGALHTVHPTRDEVGGVPAVASVADLPVAPDAAYIGVNRSATVDIVRDLAAMGAGGAICFASGYREASAELDDGADLQDALVAAAGDMPILGPNCYGLVNYLDRVALWPDIHGGLPVDRGVAIVLQSSNIAINLTMQRRGLPLAFVVTAGNQAQTDLVAVGLTLLADDRVTALGLYIEGVDPERLQVLAAQARRTGKSIVALRAGRTAVSQAATVSHTASLAGSAAGADALQARLGIARVGSLSVLLETLKLLHLAGPLPSRRIVSLSSSGGEAGLVADIGAALGLSFPAFSATQVAGLRAALGGKVALANPLDYHTYIWSDPDRMAACFAAALSGDVAMGALILDIPRPDRCPSPDWDIALAAAARARAETGKPLAILASLPDTMPEEHATRIAALGLVPLAGLDESLAAMAAAASVTAPVAEPILPPRPAAGARVLTEVDGKARLADHGIRVPRGGRAATPEDAAVLADRIGYPVVVKAEGLAHKTEAGGVHLGLTTAAAVRSAAAAVGGKALVEAMVTGTLVEMLIGVVLDPAHGYVLTLAAGGTWAEILDDSVSLLVPSDRDAVENAVRRLRIAPALDGWRGAPGVARAPLVDAVMAVQDFVIAEHGRIAEVEVNPLLCTADAAVAADVLIRMGEPDD